MVNGAFKLWPRPYAPAEALLRHCFALGAPDRRRPSVRARLDEALGPELAQQLVTTLTLGSRG
jgi:hypothetical protein